MITIGGKRYGDRPLVMGILNITPDSFYDGGRYRDTGRAVDHALEMIDEGADIIDIGGESSRPGAESVGIDEELNRVIPVVERLASLTDIPISVDTYRSEVAMRAADAGAVIINDISAMQFDEAMPECIASRDLTVVLMHMQGTPKTMQADPHYDDVVVDILRFLNERISFAEKKGIRRDAVIVDPGIGFGKKASHNLTILHDIGRFHETGCQVLVGASRKSFIGLLTGADVSERMSGTAAVTAHCVMQGVLIHRVHDVKAMRQVCDVAYAIRNGRQIPEG